MEIAPRVHRVEGVNGSNAVLLADEQMAVVDTGIAGNGDAIVAYIKKIGRSPRDLRWIISTHFHFDHSGSAAELRDLTDAKVVAHHGDTELTADGRRLLIKGNEGEAPPGWFRWLMGRRRPQEQQRLYHDTEVEETVRDGDLIPCLGGIRILHTPGHTPGSICLLAEEPQVLFLGDSVINNINRLSRPLMWDRAKRRELDASLHRLRDLQAQAASFGHGPPLTDEVMDRIRGLTDKPYDMATWRIVLRNWRTLRRWRARTRRPGHWYGGEERQPG